MFHNLTALVGKVGKVFFKSTVHLFYYIERLRAFLLLHVKESRNDSIYYESDVINDYSDCLKRSWQGSGRQHVGKCVMVFWKDSIPIKQAHLSTLQVIFFYEKHHQSTELVKMNDVT